MVIANENYNAAKQEREDVYSNINKLNSEISLIGKILDQSITQIISNNQFFKRNISPSLMS